MMNAIAIMVNKIVATFLPNEYPCVTITPKNRSIPTQINAIVLIRVMTADSFAVRKLETAVESIIRSGSGAIP